MPQLRGLVASEFTIPTQAVFDYNPLLGFIQANLRAALDVAWPSSGIVLSGALSFYNPSLVLELVRGILAAAGHMLTHAPQFSSLESVHVTVRYVLWTLTVLGCLVGYCYSIFGYLWGQQIRNLDFTVVGWITNAVCYWPLLGVAFWQMIPPLAGQGIGNSNQLLLHA